jgi:hypothetical protein
VSTYIRPQLDPKKLEHQQIFKLWDLALVSREKSDAPFKARFNARGTAAPGTEGSRAAQLREIESHQHFLDTFRRARLVMQDRFPLTANVDVLLERGPRGGWVTGKGGYKPRAVLGLELRKFSKPTAKCLNDRLDRLRLLLLV